MRLKTLAGLAFVAVFGFFVVTSFGSQLSGYETFTEATESGRRAHVVGEWLEAEPSRYDPDRNVFTFVMADEDGTARRVVYANPKPASFEDAEQVVVEGQMTAAGDFEAEHILVKCPSKYNEGGEFQADPTAGTPAAGGPATVALGAGR
ncbi:cytochrome c maturation protein CcmE [Rubrivirga sp. S365]|uniref:Cytochrome c maturation protein CcmE n=1 Tax=Rubrivirga litoralis TaxID=3075598 RepID=A0ABU3BVC1_9BACT|nr:MULTISPECIES: cytochrome c maturation protein CcmE [unclassified Rubrivirga]MDT0633237.1 cytochrome c maturation protein CcmE [Rubrivirga sp. F394]MDT7855123.1 cytochrome c maturation protein CcmE [Rubrivirga sp. S365]